METKDQVVDERGKGTFHYHRSSMTSPSILELERERIFDLCWLYIGHESEVEQPGDYRRRTVAGQPLFMVRGRDGRVRVFLNLCPHRGALICRNDAGIRKYFSASTTAGHFSTPVSLWASPAKMPTGRTSIEAD